MAHIDKLKLISGEPIQIADNLCLIQPTLKQIKDFGESVFYNTFWSMCSSAYDMPSMFADMGIDFMSVSDWQYFMAIVGSCTPEKTSLIFGDLNFSEFQQMMRTNPDGTQDVVLYREDGMIIDETLYDQFIPYLREIIGFTHTGKKAGNEATKKILIMDDRKKKKEGKKKENESMLFDLIVSLVNTEEFSYTYETVFNLTIYQLMKSSIQIQGKKSAMALLQGSMSGFADTSNIPKEDFSWMYSEDKYKPKGKKLVNQTIKKGK